MIWILIIIAVIVLLVIFQKGNSSDARSIEAEDKLKYEAYIRPGTGFSDNLVELLDELQGICYEIAEKSVMIQSGKYSFQSVIMLELDVETKLSKGTFIIQPGGGWNNDYALIGSLEGKQIRRILNDKFEFVDEDEHYCQTQVLDIDGLYERFARSCQRDEEISETMMRVGYETLVKAWNGAPAGYDCTVEESHLSDNRSINNKITVHIVYRYSKE